MKMVSALTRWFRSFATRGPRSGASKSELVGMYLTQTNSRDGYSAELQQNRQRRNGKYSHNRERA
jgi:hypothetical protein